MGTVVAWYAIAVGILMLGWWALDLRGGALQRPDRSRGEMVFHLVAEGVTAALLVIGGIALLGDGGRSVALVALGMLLYTTIQSVGYFVHRGERAPVVMFVVLQVATVAAIVVLVAR